MRRLGQLPGKGGRFFQSNFYMLKPADSGFWQVSFQFLRLDLE
jgi:hypothetical protein